MVTHETYRAADGRWLNPDEVERRGGQWIEQSERRIRSGRIEKMSSPSATRSIEPIVPYGADAVRAGSCSPTARQADLEWSEGRDKGRPGAAQRMADHVPNGPATAGSPALARKLLVRSPRSAREYRALAFNRAVANLTSWPMPSNRPVGDEARPPWSYSGCGRAHGAISPEAWAAAGQPEPGRRRGWPGRGQPCSSKEEVTMRPGGQRSSETLAAHLFGPFGRGAGLGQVVRLLEAGPRAR